MSKLTEIKESLKAATPGPWTTWERSDGIQVVEKDGELSICDMDGGSWQEWLDNARLIANAPEYITYLISLLEEKDKALAFYADNDNWENGHAKYNDEGDKVGTKSYVEEDGGEIARKALNTSSNNEGDN